MREIIHSSSFPDIVSHKLHPDKNKLSQNDCAVLFSVLSQSQRLRSVSSHRCHIFRQVSTGGTQYDFNAVSFLQYPLTHPPEQNGCHFADDIFKCIFVNEKFCILIPISLKSVPKGSIDNNSALVRVMAWRRTGDKKVSEPMLTQFIDAFMRHQGEMS